MRAAMPGDKLQNIFGHDPNSFVNSNPAIECVGDFLISVVSIEVKYKR